MGFNGIRVDLLLVKKEKEKRKKTNSTKPTLIVRIFDFLNTLLTAVMKSP